MQYMAVILIIGGGMGCGFACLQLVCYGSQWLVQSRSGAAEAILLLPGTRVVIDANALVDCGSVAIGACTAALSY